MHLSVGAFHNFATDPVVDGSVNTSTAQNLTTLLRRIGTVSQTVNGYNVDIMNGTALSSITGTSSSDGYLSVSPSFTFANMSTPLAAETSAHTIILSVDYTNVALTFNSTQMSYAGRIFANGAPTSVTRGALVLRPTLSTHIAMLDTTGTNIVSELTYTNSAMNILSSTVQIGVSGGSYLTVRDPVSKMSHNIITDGLNLHPTSHILHTMSHIQFSRSHGLILYFVDKEGESLCSQTLFKNESSLVNEQITRHTETPVDYICCCVKFLLVENSISYAFSDIINDRVDKFTEPLAFLYLSDMQKDELEFCRSVDFDPILKKYGSRSVLYRDATYNKLVHKLLEKRTILKSVSEQILSGYQYRDIGSPKCHKTVAETRVSCAVRETTEETGIPERLFTVVKDRECTETFVDVDGWSYVHHYFLARLHKPLSESELAALFADRKDRQEIVNIFVCPVLGGHVLIGCATVHHLLRIRRE